MARDDTPKDDRREELRKREARLAKALRANLKRRKAPPSPPAPGEKP